MASSNNVFCADGFVEDGYYELIATPAPPSVLFNLGAPGAPVHALPFRALGGSVADLDLLYGILGSPEAKEDIQPIFALATRDGLLRSFSYEVPRQAIQDAVIEHFATLLSVDDFTISGNPAGDNLFGYVALTTRPISTVRMANDDGFWTRLILRELLIYSPAGLYIDIAHQVVMPVLTGVITAYTFDQDGSIVLSYGQAPRRTAPLDLVQFVQSH